MDPRRSISIVVVTSGVATTAIGLAGSSLPLTLDATIFAAAGPILGAVLGTYVGRRATFRRRAALAAAYGAGAAGVLIVAIFGMAGLIRPSISGVSELEAASAGIVMAGTLVVFVGA